MATLLSNNSYVYDIITLQAMTKPNEKLQAITLRKQGESITTIARKLHISKSTASTWCKDINLTQKQLEHIAKLSGHRATLGLLHASEQQRKKRQEDIVTQNSFGSKDVGILTDRDLFMVGLGLYWGEGYKKGSQELGFTNSDPLIILFYIEWLKKIYRIDTKSLILRISINAQHASRVDTVLAFWSALTKISESQFTKTSLIKTSSKKRYSNYENHYGTLRIKVRRGTQLRRRILGSIASLTPTAHRTREILARNAQSFHGRSSLSK